MSTYNVYKVSNNLSGWEIFWWWSHLLIDLHTDNSLLDIVNINLIWIVITIFWLIRQPTGFCLVPYWLENGNYPPNLVYINKIQKRFSVCKIQSFTLFSKFRIILLHVSFHVSVLNSKSEKKKTNIVN